MHLARLSKCKYTFFIHPKSHAGHTAGFPEQVKVKQVPPQHHDLTKGVSQTAITKGIQTHPQGFPLQAISR